VTQPTYRIATLFLALVSSAALAQQAKPATPAPTPAPGSIASHPGWPAAKPEDVKSPEAIVAAVYDVISGPAGQQRNWDRMRSLFLPESRLIPATVIAAKDGAPAHADALVMTIDGYITRSGSRLTTAGFFERSIHNETEQYGNIVQIWSTYESRHSLDEAKPFARGINSFQLLKDGDRYWVVTVFWDSERPGNPIPAKYLP
jgi:hypothetical protein